MIYLNRCKPFFALFFISFFACQNNQDTSQLKKEILIRHEQERKFHFEKKASEFANSLSENIIMVNRMSVTSLYFCYIMI